MLTCDRVILIALLVLGSLGVSGCLPPGELAGQSFTPRSAVTALRVSQNDVTIVGPAGYCVDKSSSQERRSGSFVILGSCAAMHAGNTQSPQAPGVLTALVSAPTNPPQKPTSNQLERFLRSDAGRAALAHDGKAASVTLLQIDPKGDILYLHVRDKSESRPTDLSDRSWRAVFALKGRLVALTVTGHNDRPLKDSEAKSTLERFVTAVRAANPEKGPEDS